MSFDIVIQDMDNHVSLDDWHEARDAAFKMNGVHRGTDRVTIVLPNGDEVEFHDAGNKVGGMLSLRALSLPIAKLVYDLISQSGLFLLAMTEIPRAVRADCNNRPRFSVPDIEELSMRSSDELFTYLEGGYAAWEQFKGRCLAEAR
jgi:hypothetical protein